MYRSANYVLFVNYEDFLTDIDAQLAKLVGKMPTFSRYDCDSLAMEAQTHFVRSVLLLRARPNAWLELRTKSIQTRPLLDEAPFENCVVAFANARCRGPVSRA